MCNLQEMNKKEMNDQINFTNYNLEENIDSD